MSLSVTFLFSMMTFCKKSVQSLLGLTTHKTNGTVLLETPHHDRNIPSPAGGISFITLSGNTQLSVPNFLESAVAKSPPSSPAAAPNRDPGGIGFLEDVGGSVGGLMSCTESLGFESSDERGVNDDDQLQNMSNDEFCLKRTIPIVRSPKNEVLKKKFPPPLSSLDQNGKPTFFLRHVRKDGRLQLTEMKIHRPEILHASRQDGRLRLHLISSSDEDEDEDEDVDVDVDVEEVLQDKAKEEEEEEEEVKGGGGGKRGEEWRFPVKNGGRDGIRRCHEVASQHHHHHHHHNQHHHNLHAWRQHCVTIR
ncbi:uncharacterized protein LOC132294656 [Cornus florida]|uniref:uncharacterized protein LOC132294656 n=1 Tax=Cornus florida TaxID=4283 RepID=UPI00289E3B5B|nr:uncharacterized protein LOC132294656 [Cornus florida]